MKDFIPASHPASLEHPSTWTLSARHYVGERHPLISLIYLGLALGSFLMGAHWAAAGSVDTDLSFLSFLELYGTEIAERRMPARRVVEALDVVEHI